MYEYLKKDFPEGIRTNTTVPKNQKELYQEYHNPEYIKKIETAQSYFEEITPTEPTTNMTLIYDVKHLNTNNHQDTENIIIQNDTEMHQWKSEIENTIEKNSTNKRKR